MATKELAIPLRTVQDMQVMMEHLQEMQASRDYHGMQWTEWTELRMENEEYAQHGYEICTSDVIDYLTGGAYN